MTPGHFVNKWRYSTLTERSGAQQHFLDLCRLLEEPTPAEADPDGNFYCFEKGINKDSGAPGWADVWKRNCFAWEYKRKHGNLDAAFDQLRQYALALENPPLLIVSDMIRIRIRTNWTISVSESYDFDLDDLLDGASRQKLKWAMSDPEKLRPQETRQTFTERAAETFAVLAHSLRDQGHPPEEVAHFVNRLIFCMFAEDVGLLPNHMFTRMLGEAFDHPEEFTELAGMLFRAMSVGGRVGLESVKNFDGGLFEDDTALPMNREQIRITLKSARLNWSNIDPSILGTLFERGLDPDKRSQLGAHYTDKDKIMRIIRPVIVRPLLAEWGRSKEEIRKKVGRAQSANSRSAASRFQNQGAKLFDSYLDRLKSFIVLDPACGSGNFLYLALHALHDFEQRVQLEAEALGLQRTLPNVGPANVKGIELNAYAAELARVSVWIGEIQWLRRNGYAGSQEPILDPMETVECRDAILTPEGEEPDWPEADVIIGNPPFLGGKRLNANLGRDYVAKLFAVYKDRVPHAADLVCYWFQKAGEQMDTRSAKRAGLVATNSIRGGRNNLVLQRAARSKPIFDAWSDEPWIIDGAAVRVSMVCLARADDEMAQQRRLNGNLVDEIYTDLTAGSLEVASDVTKAVPLAENAGVAFQGDIKGGGFDVSGDLARKWLREPANPNGRTNSDVLRPWINAESIVQRPADKWIIDFGCQMELEDAALFEAPFEHVRRHVKPAWDLQPEDSRRPKWWLHQAPRSVMRKALTGLSRCIATPRVSKHRLFVWMDCRICPSSAVIVVARDDDAIFGILHSRIHELWSLRLGTWLGMGNDPRYTHTTTFVKFPFPNGLSPDIPASDLADNPHAQAIGSAARSLVEQRDRWLNPPELVACIDEPVPGYPPRLVPRDQRAATRLKDRTLTNLYNLRPQWLTNAHNELDAAVAASYGWPADLSDELILHRLLVLNGG